MLTRRQATPCVVTNLTNGHRNSRAKSYRLLRSQDPPKKTQKDENLIACAVKEATRAINASLVANGSLLPFGKVLLRAFHETLVAGKKDFHTKAASLGSDKAIAHDG